MAVLYVDESGEEGFSPTSTEWLILGGALQPAAALDPMKLAYDSFKATHCQPNWHFHFQSASHDMRLGFIAAMRETGFRGFAIAIYKPSINRRDNFTKRYFLYFYALRFLLERVTTYCHTHCQEPLAVYLSNRRGLTTENLQAYLDRILTSPFIKQDKMKWDYLSRAHIFTHDNKEWRGLQMADCVASSVAKTLELSKYGTIEPRYVAELHPCFHHDSLEYGKAVQFWPSIPSEHWHERLLPAFKAGRALRNRSG
ncbi:DUF3800 domain-containing protein [Mesorhizobium sp.]|uniref:DUF3800 domain-containing protein n=1 Tax=Mesorhizobium sp. TaxID=1871066 RepID=UPI000FE9A755|nr:DUF3800 domain-containing protein [Mesorhizobium sp.]RWB60452.1 MAG: DUF3800 domain-containing protein [Mesorhizobium sp.]